MKKILFALFVTMCFMGCSSLDKGKQIKLHGLIMDSDGKGVPSYRIMKGNREVALTNSKGYFEVNAVYGEGVNFQLKKKDWETIDFCEEKCDLTNLYVFKARSIDSVCREIEKSLDECDYEKLESIFAALPDELHDKTRVKYLEAVACFNQDKIDEALEILYGEEFMENNGGAVNEFVSMLERKKGGKE
ncbi:MAG: hypothetical protein J6S91_00270 [Treponema sp.]|nr:hypothetical protein [Treponema sp.]